MAFRNSARYGLVLESDVHVLFDGSYLTATDDWHHEHVFRG